MNNVRTHTKSERFTMRLEPNDRVRLNQLAKRFQRSASDTIRWLIRQAAENNSAIEKQNK